MIWIIMIGIGILTFIIRLSFIILADRLSLPAALQRALNFVPIAALTAILVPAIIQPSGILNISFTNGRLIAGTLAIIIAWRTKNTFITIGAGMLCLWFLRFVLKFS
jgi:branched-subunit amino acid transport protein